MAFIGIDPGIKGAFALMDNTGDVLFVQDLPTYVDQGAGPKGADRTRIDAAAFAAAIDHLGGCMAFIERPVGRAMRGKNRATGQDITVGVSAKSMLSLGESFGKIVGVCAAHRIDVMELPPHTWKRPMSIPQDKEEARLIAIRLYPRIASFLTRKKDHDRAEAVLLARYGFLRFHKK